MPHKQKLQCAGHVAWIVEPQGVVLMHTLHARHCRIAYPEAAVWDLLTRGRPEKTICSMLQLIAGVSLHEAEGIVRSCRDTWVEEGWLEAGEQQ